jgi:hypothetical protein
MGDGMRTYDGITRTEARRFECPNCGAQPGEKCNGGRRESNHRERVHAAARARRIQEVDRIITTGGDARRRVAIEEDGRFVTPDGVVSGCISLAYDLVDGAFALTVERSEEPTFTVELPET